MNETAVSNTGPVRHLFEIGQVHTLTLFSDIYLPKQVKDELLAQGVWGSLESTIGRHLHVENVADSDVDAKLATFAPFKLHRADASEFTNDEASYGYFSCRTVKAQCSADG